MAILRLKDEILLVNDSLNLDEITNKLANIPSKTMVGFFKKNKIVLPVRLKREVFLKVLCEPALLKINDAHLRYEDKILFEHLPSLTIYQLTKLLEKLDSETLNKNYLKELWLNVLNYLFNEGVDERLIVNFIYLKQNKNELDEDILEYNINLKEIFIDGDGEFEGLSYDDLRLVLYKTVSKEILIDLVKIHNVKLPKKFTIKEGVEHLLKNAKHSKPFYSEVTDQSIYEKPLIKLEELKEEVEAELSLEDQIIKEINDLKVKINELKVDIKEIQELEIVLVDEEYEVVSDEEEKFDLVM